MPSNINNPEMPLYVVCDNKTLAAAKADGSWPLAHFTFLQSENADPVTGHSRIYYAEIIASDPGLPFVPKGDPNRYIEEVELEELKHIVWAGVEVLHRKSHVVMEHGTHILDVDISKHPEAICGAVAAWSTHPVFGKYAPTEGWVQLVARHVGGGTIHYVVSDALADGAGTKHDYEDMLLGGVCNFRLFLPPFLDTPRVDANGEVGGTWIESVIKALSLSPEDSIKAGREALTKWHMNDNAFKGATRAVATGREPSNPALVLNGIEDGTTIDLAELDVNGKTDVYVYAKIGQQLVNLRTIRWDGSAFARALVNQFRQHRFGLVSL